MAEGFWRECEQLLPQILGEMMTLDLTTIKDWLVPVSTFVALITASIGGWLSLREHRLKVRAETRVSQSTELESDIKLIKLFIEIMDIAHARGGSQLSEKAVEMILKPEVIHQLNLNGHNISSVLENAIVKFPIGFAAQDAAISAIWTLGKKHKILTPIAIQALTSLNTFKGEVVSGYLKDLVGKEKVLAAVEKARVQ